MHWCKVRSVLLYNVVRQKRSCVFLEVLEHRLTMKLSVKRLRWQTLRHLEQKLVSGLLLLLPPPLRPPLLLRLLLPLPPHLLPLLPPLQPLVLRPLVLRLPLLPLPPLVLQRLLALI